MKKNGSTVISICIALAMGLTITGVNAEQAAASTDAQPKIINGINATDAQFPWQVGLMIGSTGLYNNQFCSGTIIDARWVVTAAHCVNGNTTGLHIIAGVRNLFDESNAQVIAVDNVQIHPQFSNVASSNALNHDIALLRLRTPIDFLRCGQRCSKIDWLSTTTESASIQRGTAALISGWGRTVDCQTEPQRCRDLNSSSTGGLLLSPAQLQWGTVNIDGCLSGNSRHDTAQISANMLCASAPLTLQDSCQGDSGGGMTVTAADGRGQVLAGITSWGRGCAQAGFPAVYTRVARYDQWIKNRIAGRPSSADPVVSEVDNSLFWQNLNPPRTNFNTSSSGGSIGLWGLGLLAILGLIRQQRQRNNTR